MINIGQHKNQQENAAIHLFEAQFFTQRCTVPHTAGEHIAPGQARKISSCVFAKARASVCVCVKQLDNTVKLTDGGKKNQIFIFCFR
jgi:hypothetical protein